MRKGLGKRNKVIFGIGKEGKKILRDIDVSEVLCIVDNNQSLWGTSYQNIPIVSLNEILEKKDEIEIIVSSIKNEKEISRQLADKGFHFINNAKFYIDAEFKGKNGKKIILLNTHVFTNIGDHAIVIAEYYFFRKFFSEYEVIEISAPFCKYELDYVKGFIHDEDILTITGGGYLGSLWMDCGENNVRAILNNFPNNKIIIMPQTMFFENNEDENKQMTSTKQIYGMHSNLSICMRDKASYSLAKKILPQTVSIFLIPDMVALLNRSYEIYPRRGCIFCFREDKECVVLEEEKNRIKDYIEESELQITFLSMHTKEWVDKRQRMDAVNEKIRALQRSRLVITDRLHCMLLCAISGTPCIAFDNLSKKISGTYEWIKHLEYIELANGRSNILEKIDKLLQYKTGIYDNSVFIDKYRELFKIIAHSE